MQQNELNNSYEDQVLTDYEVRELSNDYFDNMPNGGIRLAKLYLNELQRINIGKFAGWEKLKKEADQGGVREKWVLALFLHKNDSDSECLDIIEQIINGASGSNVYYGASHSNIYAEHSKALRQFILSKRSNNYVKCDQLINSPLHILYVGEAVIANPDLLQTSAFVENIFPVQNFNEIEGGAAEAFFKELQLSGRGDLTAVYKLYVSFAHAIGFHWAHAIEAAQGIDPNDYPPGKYFKEQADNLRQLWRFNDEIKTIEPINFFGMDYRFFIIIGVCSNSTQQTSEFRTKYTTQRSTISELVYKSQDGSGSGNLIVKGKVDFRIGEKYAIVYFGKKNSNVGSPWGAVCISGPDKGVAHFSADQKIDLSGSSVMKRIASFLLRCVFMLILGAVLYALLDVLWFVSAITFSLIVFVFWGKVRSRP
jgi:hypothetical protein